MPSTIVNFAEVDSFEPLPEGSYDVEVDKVEVRRNKADDGNYLNWEMVVIDGEFENRRLWMITSLKATALFRLKQVLQELGVLDGDDEEMELEWDDDVDPSTSGGPRLLFPELEGMEAIAVVKNEMYDGRERNRVEQLNGVERKPKTKKRTSNSNQSSSSKRRKDEDSEPQSSRRREREVEDDQVEDDEEEEEEPHRRSGSERTKSRSRDRARRRVR